MRLRNAQTIKQDVMQDYKNIKGSVNRFRKYLVFGWNLGSPTPHNSQPPKALFTLEARGREKRKFSQWDA